MIAKITLRSLLWFSNKEKGRKSGPVKKYADGIAIS